MHGTESRVVIGPSNLLLVGVYVSIFQPEILQAGTVKWFKKKKKVTYITSLRCSLKWWVFLFVLFFIACICFTLRK